MATNVVLAAKGAVWMPMRRARSRRRCPRIAALARHIEPVVLTRARAGCRDVLDVSPHAAIAGPCRRAAKLFTHVVTVRLP